MPAPVLPAPSGNLTSEIQGVWWLLSREDYTKDGEKKIDPTLGADPFGILTYTPSYFAAQFMKRNRKDDQSNQALPSGKNNTSAVGGYDAYFGTYDVNEETGSVTHTLIGSLSPGNIGMTTVRDLRVFDDKLMIQLVTSTPEGEEIIRTLIWKRIN